MLVAVQLSVLGLYLPPVFESRAGVISAPDDHFTAGPDCRVTIRAAGALVVLVAVQLSVLGLYLPPVFRYAAASISTPDDHFTAGPDCRVNVSGSGRVGGAGGCPTVRAGIVSPASVRIAVASHIRPRRSFHCRSRLPCERLGQWARWWCWWLSNCPCWDCISRQCSIALSRHPSTPDDHFTAGPDCRVTRSGRGRVGGAGGCPTIRAGIVSAAGVQTAATIVHPRRSFHCRSRLPCDRLGQRAHWWCS